MTLKGQTVKIHSKSGVRTVKILEDDGEYYTCLDNMGNEFRSSKEIYDKMFFHRIQPIRVNGFKGDNPRMAHRIYSKK